MNLQEVGSRDESDSTRSLLGGAFIDIIYLSMVTGSLLVLPPVVSFITPFSFPFWNAMALYALSVTVIVLVVAIETGQKVMNRG